MQNEADKPLTSHRGQGRGSSASLAERVSRKLSNDAMLTTQHAPSLIRMDLERLLANVWERGHVAVGELWGYYATYPYMPRLRDRSVLDTGIRSVAGLWAWNLEGFATAESYEPEADEYRGLVLPSDERPVNVHDGLLLVRPDRAQAQRDREVGAQAATIGAEAETGEGGAGAPTETGEGAPSAQPAPAGPPPKTRFFGVRSLSPDRYAADFKKITDEVIHIWPPCQAFS